MIQDRATYREEAIRELASAGARGLPLDHVGIGMGIWFELMGWARREGERLFIEPKGRAYLQRGAFA